MISFICIIFKKTEPLDTENRLVIARGRGWAMREVGKGGQSVQTSSYKIKHVMGM